MTKRDKYVRASLYGCAHRPKFSALWSPKVGDYLQCAICKRSRLVVRLIPDEPQLSVTCDGCSWKITDTQKTYGATKALATRHANAQTHVVRILHNGAREMIKPQKHYQPSLIDPLLLP